MKKMSFTNSRWTSLLGRSVFLALFAICFAGLQTADAQIKMEFSKFLGDTCTTLKLDACNGDPTSSSTLFTDDGENDGNYTDPTANREGRSVPGRIDTTEICPQDRWHFVKVVFTKFDLEEGATVAESDRLEVYQGTKAQVRGIDANGNAIPQIGVSQTATGTGVGEAFGGWVYADCDPADNASGCLTFIFRTDGDNQKGAGWEAWVDCENRNIRLDRGGADNVKLACTDLGYAAISLKSPRLRAASGCTNVDPRVIMRVRNQHGDQQSYDIVNADDSGLNASGITKNFAIGQYSVEYKLLSDSTKTHTSYFSVQAPALVCNDNVVVPLGSACMIVLTPDDVLEAPCNETTDLQGHVSYSMSVTIPGAHGFKDRTVSVPSGERYPVITVDDIKAAGQSVCSATATVTVTRTIYADALADDDNDSMTDSDDAAELAIDVDGTDDYDVPVVGGVAVCNNGLKTASCSTTMTFSDDSQPWISVDVSADTLIACDESQVLSLVNATAIDNCTDELEVTMTVSIEENDPCFRDNGKADTTTATVSFRSVDECGNVGSTSRTFTIIRPTDLRQFIAKTSNVQADCKAGDFETAGPGLKTGPWKNGSLDPKTTDTVALSTEEYICGYILTKRDINVPATDCGRKIYRYWSILDWCTPENGPSAVDTTFIEYIDNEQPYFVDTTSTRMDFDRPGTSNDFTAKRIATDVQHSLGHFECTYDADKLTKPAAIDNCDDNVTVTRSTIYWVDEDGILQEIVDKDLECGDYFVRWVASDICHEQDIDDVAYQFVKIVDDTKPSAVATDQLNISLPNEWGARICVKDIDAGSYDACGIKEMGIRIKGKGGEFTECIDIGCEYVHPDLQIELRVVDKKGNENLAWTDILVEDKIAPVCDDLDPVERYCDEFHNGELGASTDADGDRKFEDSEWAPLTGELLAKYESYFGKFNCVDNLNGENCGALTRVEEYQLIEWPCGEIEIKRRIVAEDWSQLESAPAHQDIKIVYRAGWSFTVPDDWTGKCGDEAIAPALDIDNGACDLLGYEVTSKLFEVPGDACFKMERTYHIINWCKYTAGEAPVEIARVEGEHGFAEGFTITSEGNEDKGYWTYVQILKVHDDEGPVVTVVDPEPCISGIDFDALPYGEEDITPGTAPYECDEPKTWTASATDCSDESAITWEGKLYDANGNVVATSKTNSITFVVTNKSTYTAEFWAFDGCGNSGGEKGETLKFWDCKKPTPYAINGIAIELMQTGMISVWATDLDQGSFDNCTDQSKLDLRLWHATLGDAPTDLAGVQALPKVIDFTCTELGTQNVQLYAIDEEGNYDFVQTYVIVQDNMGACQGDPVAGGMVAGRIVDGNGENVESVSIAVNGADSRNMTTSADGQFEFVLPMGGDYTVTPEKDMNPLNGVSTFDLVLISKHILGISTFDTPYKYIAADVNKSGSITAFDMVQLRQLILNITSEFPNNDSWRFVEGGYEFTSANPAAESFNEFVSINNLASDMMHADFTAVKIGDVNGNASANSLLGAESRTTNGTLNLNVADRFVEAGQTVTVEFTSADIASATGYQFTMNVAGAANVVEGVAKAANFNTNMATRGVIATSWNGEATANDVLFAIDFTANTTGLLSEMVSITSDVVAAEAYNTDGDLMNVSIEFGAATAAGFELNQNTPNPFNAETLIGFNLPVAGTATLKVMDVQGKVLKAITADYAKGYNQVSLNANELGATGVLYYQLESADNVATKKMIIIE